jgi:hypothetical protein
VTAAIHGDPSKQQINYLFSPFQEQVTTNGGAGSSCSQGASLAVCSHIEVEGCDTNAGLFITGDYLYWQPEVDQLTYATETSVVPTAKSQLIDQRFNWGSGFRVGLGSKLHYDRWTLYLNWTHFDHTSKGKAKAGSNSSIFATPLTGALQAFATGEEARSSWSFDMNMLDLELGRTFCLSKKFGLHPHVGLKGGWLDQTQKVHYPDFIDSSSGFPLNSTIKMVNDFAGIGPRFGLNTRWVLGKEFGIFGNLSGALLYGFFNIHEKFKLDEPAIDLFIDRKITHNQHRLRPTVQMLFGLDWGHCFGHAFAIHLKAAYELQYWWSQWLPIPTSQGLLSGDFTGSGDLTIHGLTVSGAIAF